MKKESVRKSKRFAIYIARTAVRMPRQARWREDLQSSMTGAVSWHFSSKRRDASASDARTPARSNEKRGALKHGPGRQSGPAQGLLNSEHIPDLAAFEVAGVAAAFLPASGPAAPCTLAVQISLAEIGHAVPVIDPAAA